MAIINCPECGHEVSDRAKTCPHCGVAIAGQITTCPDCGEVIFKDAAQCSNCHCPINGASIGEEHHVVAQKKHSEPLATGEGNKTQKTENQKVKRTYTGFVVSLVIALIIVLLGLYFYQTTEQQNELHAYENALSSGEPAVLQNFLDIYTDAPKQHRDSIQFHLNELKKIDLEWDNAKAGKSKNQLLQYIGRHPGNVHVTEAKYLIDSLDWEVAVADHTADAFQLYLDEHPEGAHIDEARQEFDRLDALRVKPDERDMLRKLFADFFDALSKKDEARLTSCLAENMSSFMEKEHATRADGVHFMHTLYSPNDISSIAFTVSDDMKVVKQPLEAEGMFVYAVSFIAEKRIDRSDQELERFASYKVTARVSPVGKVTAFNMQKVM